MGFKNKTNFTEKFNSIQLKRAVIVGLICLGVVAVTLFFSIRLPFNGIFIPLSLLILALIFKWPSFGLCLSIAIVIVCEIFSTPDIVSPYTSLLLTNINSFTTIPFSATLLEIIIGWTTFATFIKFSLSGRKLHPWSPLSIGAAILGANILFSFIWGSFIKHGDHQVALWEVRSLVYIVVIYFLTISLADSDLVYKALNWIFPLCTLVLCIMSFWRGLNFDQMLTGGDHYLESLNGFNHEDAVIFTIGFMWCLHKLLFNGTFVEKLASLLLMGPMITAVLISGRRAAFASMAADLIVLLIVLFVRRRRAFVFTIIALVIIVPPYLLIFEHVDGPLGLPARAFSAGSGSNEVGSRDYNSDLYRVIEKSNVQLTIKQSPILGVGFGQEFIQFTPMVTIDVFTFQNYTPHVQVLWLWLKLGIIGWVTFWFMVCGALFRMSQLIKYDNSRTTGNMATLAGFILAGFMVFAYVDISLGSVRVCTLIGLSLGLMELSYRKLTIVNTKQDVEEETSLRLIKDEELVAVP